MLQPAWLIQLHFIPRTQRGVQICCCTADCYTHRETRFVAKLNFCGNIFSDKLPKRFDYSSWVMNIILLMDEIDNVSVDGNCTNPFSYDHFDSAYEIARAGDTNVLSWLKGS